MFGFNRNRGIFNRYNNYSNYNYGPFSGYDNSARREENFIRKYIIFRLILKIAIPILLLLMIMSGMTRRNNSNINTNNFNNLNSSYSVEGKI